MASLPSSMHAWRTRIGEADPIVRRQVPVPTPAASEILVKIQAMGVCHSDCSIRDREQLPPTWMKEFTLGHEGAGEVVSLGADVDASLFRIGDRVAIQIVPGCNDCLTCRMGHQRLCKEPGNGGYGLGRDGMFQEYAAVRADAAVKVPESVSIEEAALAADAILTAYEAVKYTANVQPGQTILLMGLGGLGLNGLQTVMHLGVKRIIVCDTKQAALDVAIRFGVPPEDAIRVGGAQEKPLNEILTSRGIVVDTVIDFAGHEQTILAAQLCVRPGGLIVVVGLLSRQATLIPVVVASSMITIKGSFAGTIDSLRECLELMAQGVIRPEIETRPIGELLQTMKDLDNGSYTGRRVFLPEWGS